MQAHAQDGQLGRTLKHIAGDGRQLVLLEAPAPHHLIKSHHTTHDITTRHSNTNRKARSMFSMNSDVVSVVISL